jgi:L-ribulose-5-phosphate 3-epimerase
MFALSACGASFAGFATPAASPLRRFKLGVISDEFSQDFEEALKAMKQLGLTWVEIRTVWGAYNTEASPAQVQRLKDLLDKYQFRVSVVDTALYKCNLPGTENVVKEKDAYPYPQQMDLLSRAIDRAQALGTDKLRVFAFWRVADPQRHYPRIAEELAKAAEVAEKAKMRLALEDEGSCNVGSGHELAAMLKLVPAVNLGANWDVGNGYWHGEVSYPEGYAALDKKRIWHMHLKDVRCGAAASAKEKAEAFRKQGTRVSEQSKCQTAIVGTGQVDLAGQLRALLRDNYDGTMSLEPEYEAPGVTHFEATRRSLEGLLKTMATAV